MILLDTNVVSEVMAPTPAPRVVEWLDARDASILYVSSVTIAEIRYGLNLLPGGRRRRDLEARLLSFLALGLDQRVLAFDVAAAELYASLMAHRRRQGRPLASLDGQIAAIARSRKMAVATRNVRDFEDCGVEILNPFEG